MAISDYLRALRAKIGHDLVLVPSATGFVLDDTGRILLARHATHGAWVMPGGAIDPDEAPSDAVVREVWEETGIWVEPIALSGVFGGPELRVRYANGDEAGYVMSVFECRVLGGEARADGEETLDARFFDPPEIDRLAIAPWVGTVLPAVLANRGRPWASPASWRPGRR